MNPLPIIAKWLDTFSYHDCSGMSRKELLSWVRQEFPQVPADLAVDCLIACGIGREQEQEQTVYCRVW